MLCMVLAHFEMDIDFAADIENVIIRQVWNRVSIEGCSRENVVVNRPLQKRERTGKEYGCFKKKKKSNIFKW